jgi:hypothetical protein
MRHASEAEGAARTAAEPREGWVARGRPRAGAGTRS